MFVLNNVEINELNSAKETKHKQKQRKMLILTIINITVKINVMNGVIEGNTWCSISCTRPDVIETDMERTGNK